MTDQPIRPDIEGLQELASKATKGEWFVVGQPWLPNDCPAWINAGSDDPHIGQAVCEPVEILEWPAEQDSPDYSQADSDMEFIAAARNAAEPLCRYALHMERELAQARRRASLTAIAEGDVVAHVTIDTSTGETVAWESAIAESQEEVQGE